MKKVYTSTLFTLSLAIVCMFLSCSKKIAKTPTLPTVLYSMSGNEKTSPCLVTFTNNSKDASSYSWNFGDGSAASSDINPSHTYTAGGIYIVTLTATSTNGSSSRSDTFLIKESPKPTLADFTFTGDGKPAPCLVTFTDSSKNANSLSWDFGDGSPTSAEKNPIHNYVQSGVFTVTLLATGTSGSHSKTATVNIKALELPTNPTTASFTFTGNKQPAPCKITFTNTSQNATSYLWNFGDASTSTEVNPVHTFKSAGKFNVTLSATATDGVKTFTETITIIAPTTPNNPSTQTISFSKDIQPMFNSICSSCHNGKKHPLNLTSGNSFASLSAKSCINKASPSSSKFYTKINAGGSMAKYSNAPYTARVLQWIKEGAKNN